jgi:nicotinamide riboside kinase
MNDGASGKPHKERTTGWELDSHPVVLFTDETPLVGSVFALTMEGGKQDTQADIDIDVGFFDLTLFTIDSVRLKKHESRTLFFEYTCRL